MRVLGLGLTLSLIATTALAAPWERPAGAYTPTNHSVNTTKYQLDSANSTPISSVKVDGDINKAFQGLNDLDARTPPSVIGQAGKVLSNNGTSATWVALTSDSLVSGSTSVVANAAGTVSITAGAPAYFYSGGLVVTGVSATNVTATTLSGQHYGSISGSVVTATTVAAQQVSATGVSASAVGGQNTVISGTGVALLGAAVTISTSASACQILKSHNVSSCTRLSTGLFGISLTTPRSDAFYLPLCNGRGAGSNVSWGGTQSSYIPTVTGFVAAFFNVSGGSISLVDPPLATCITPN